MARMIDVDVLAQNLAAMSQPARGTKAPEGTRGAGGPFTPGGFFGVLGLEEEVISTRITPRGILGEIPVFADVKCAPQFGYITGIQQDGTQEPSSECETCLSGETFVCTQTAQFGYVCRETKALDATHAIERINAGEIDVRLINDIVGPMSGGMVPPANIDQRTALAVASVWNMMEVGVLLQNVLVPMLWQGNPANDVGSGYKEFPGFDMLISTGKVDANKGTACCALDSMVRDFGYNDVGTYVNGAYPIVRELEYMEANLRFTATRQNLMPVGWKLAMREELFYELTNVWPVTYMSTRGLTLQTGVQLAIDAGSVRQMADEMRAGQFLMINGRRIDVDFDDGIFEATNGVDGNVPAGEYSSSIYFLPWTYMGGRPGFYLQHKDYRLLTPEYSAARVSQYYWTDGGRFQWTSEVKKWCYSISSRTEPRLVLRVPQLAGRIDHIVYSPLQHFKSPWPTDPSNYCAGGVSTQTLPNLYSEWNQQRG